MFRSIEKIALSIVFVLGVCFFSFAEQADRKINVFVSIAPEIDFVSRIGGEHVTVKALVKTGQSPATYSPGARQMAAFLQADVFFRIGVPFENALMPKIENATPHPVVVDLRKGIVLRKMLSHVHDADDEHYEHDGHFDHEQDEDHDGHDGHAEHAGEQDFEGKDPHVWMSPDLVMIMAQTICDELSRLKPEQAQYFNANLEHFKADLKALSGRIAQKLLPLRDKKLFVYHPAYGYFADQFGLVQVAVELEGKEPAARQVAALVDKAREQGCRVIFVQPQFSQKTARVIANEIGGAVVAFDPLADNYIENLDEISQVIAADLS